SEGGGFTVALPDNHQSMLYASGEKGTAWIRLTALGDGGHAGSPPDNQAIKHIADALLFLLDGNGPVASYKLLDEYETAFQPVLEKDAGTVEEPLIHKLHEYMKQQTITVDYLSIGQKINVIPYKGKVDLEVRTVPYYDEKDIADFL